MKPTEQEQRFRTLFGIERQRVGPALVISPFLHSAQAARYLSGPRFFRGGAFSGVRGTRDGKAVSFICAGMGHPLVADCVLAQDAQRVNAIVFVGAAGAWRQRAIGDTVLIGPAFFDARYYKQFPGCAGFGDCPAFKPDESLALLSENMAQRQNIDVTRISVASVNSLWQQDEDLVPRLESYGAGGVDLESALFYAAAAQRGIPAVALAVVTDIPEERPYWRRISRQERRMISQRLHRLLHLALRISITAA